MVVREKEMTMPGVTIDQLHHLIGVQVRYQGVRCQVVEILEDGPTLVLQDMEQHTSIQPDQLGEANRRVPTTFTVPVWHPLEGFNPAFLDLQVLDAGEVNRGSKDVGIA